VTSGPREAFERVEPLIKAIAPAGVSYVGEGELSRFCKIAHNVFLGVVMQNLAEITVLAEKAGVPRLDFLDFMNNSVMGSVFTRYKTNAIVNLEPKFHRKPFINHCGQRTGITKNFFRGVEQAKQQRAAKHHHLLGVAHKIFSKGHYQQDEQASHGQ
jgi:3-hydroxyisobutyrate dehydrogenase-like beta-hydroxyacid dehydrogenase